MMRWDLIVIRGFSVVVIGLFLISVNSMYFGFETYGSSSPKSLWQETRAFPKSDNFDGVSRHAAIIFQDAIFVFGGGKDLIF
ncbi:MAG: hypothetical protein R3264_07785, partial [Anaerolineae bacterium]|nr:hypothetical protein [Anaerolineae bacterium]